MSSDGRVSAWLALKKAAAKYPALWVLMAVAVPLIGASALFLAPFAIPLGILALIIIKSDSKNKVRAYRLHTHTRTRASQRVCPHRHRDGSINSTALGGKKFVFFIKGSVHAPLVWFAFFTNARDPLILVRTTCIDYTHTPPIPFFP